MRTPTRPGYAPMQEAHQAVAVATYGAGHVDAAPDEAPRRHGEAFGAYRLHRYLGRGGWASVYEAEHATHGIVALKLLDQDGVSDTPMLSRFRRESAFLESVSHPNVVRVLESGQSDGIPYLAMELLRGEDLESVLQRNRRLPVATALEILRQVLGAIEAVHETGIVHRDLKPGNLILDASASELRVVLIDFGIALGNAEGAGGELYGTPDYLAPEQLLGHDQNDPRVDVYAAGVLLFELLVGQAPFEGLSLDGLMEAATGRDAPSVRSLRPGVPPALAAIVAQALQRDPAVRIQSARHFRETLETFALEANLALGATPLRTLQVVHNVTMPLELTSVIPPSYEAPAREQPPPMPRRGGGVLPLVVAGFALVAALAALALAL